MLDSDELIRTLEAAVAALKDARRCGGMDEDDHTAECRSVCSSIESCDCGYEFLRQFEGDT